MICENASIPRLLGDHFSSRQRQTLIHGKIQCIHTEPLLYTFTVELGNMECLPVLTRRTQESPEFSRTVLHQSSDHPDHLTVVSRSDLMDSILIDCGLIIQIDET
ncbi:hypothetical protein NPIL_16221 [Nephila pilipes]|uniref:Uncharacterized protein n=1 Tax=Nephila pilipes TaxID=299642 RepID=A0A8X6PBV8_NEPPI|nr:hypothetical protein NPIL_16221 [Nephila pilipes]